MREREKGKGGKGGKGNYNSPLTVDDGAVT